MSVWYAIEHPIIGLIEFNSDRTVTINGKVAWSAYRNEFDILIAVKDRLHHYDYLNEFKTRKDEQ